MYIFYISSTTLKLNKIWMNLISLLQEEQDLSPNLMNFLFAFYNSQSSREELLLIINIFTVILYQSGAQGISLSWKEILESLAYRWQL